MKTLKAVLAVLAVLLFGAANVNTTRAQGLQDVTRKTTVTITQPMEIPGGKVLQPGTYVFKLVDVIGSRNIMQIMNQDETQAIAMMIAVPDYRLKATTKPVVEYKERPAGKPVALRAWFFAAEKNGLDFVYPKQRAVELAVATHEVVPAEASEPAAETPEAFKNVPLVAITPQGEEKPMTEAFAQSPAPTEVAQALPKTASPIPVIALAGAMILAIGFGVRRFAKQNS